MYKELKFTLTDTSLTNTSTALTHAPDGWADASMSMERQKKYYGVFRNFSVPMKWAKDGATILRTVFYTSGLGSLVNVTIEKLDKYTLTYETVFTGKIDFTTFRDNDYFVEANVIDGSLAEIIKNREGDDIDLTTDHYILAYTPTTKPYVTIVGTLMHCYATEPWYVFQALVNKMTDGGVVAGTYGFKSTLLQGWAELPGTDPHYFITNESAIKCAGNSGNTVFTLITSLSDFFASINAILPIGLGVEVIAGVETLVLEEREYFFDQTSIITTLLGEVKNLGLSLCQDLIFSKIKCGWPNVSYSGTANSGNNENSNNEPNTETKFTIPTVIVKTEYDILGKYRADYEGITEAQLAGSEEVDTKDYGLFIVELAKSQHGGAYQQILGKVRKKTAPATEFYTGHVFFSPKRCLLRHQTFIESCCMGLVGQDVTFATGTNDQANNETAHNLTPTVWEKEYEGFTITDSGYFKPVLIDFEVPYPQTMISLINAAPTGILGFYYQENLYYGYLWKTETKLGGRGSVKFTLLSIKSNDLTKLAR